MTINFDWKRHWNQFAALFRKDSLFWSSAIAVTIGIASGYTNVAFRYVLHFFHWFFWDVLGNMFGIWVHGHYERAYLMPVIPLLGAALLVLLSKKFKGEILGYGFPTFLELVNVRSAALKKRWIALKTLAASICVGSGGSAGLEGPIAQVGGSVGYMIGKLAGIERGQMKVWIAAGAAGAIAAIFNAPIAGVLFAQEIILLGDFTLNTLTVTVISAGTATVITRTYFGAEPLFAIPMYESSHGWGLPLYTVMGIFIGLLAAGYIWSFHAIKERFDLSRLHPNLKPMLGAFLVGLIGVFFPQILGEGHKVMSAALFGEIGLGLAVALIFFKMLSNCLTLGSGGAGGIFGPALFTGTMIGSAFGGVANRLFPSVSDSQGLYALVGMGAFLAATTHAPLTALFLIFEITDNHHVALPTFFCTIIATTVARAIMPSSIDSLELERRGVNIHAGFELSAMNAVMVRDVMRSGVISVREETTLDTLVHLLDTSDQTCFPVVDNERRYLGMVSMSDIRQIMLQQDIWKLVVVQEIESQQIKPIHVNETMTDAIRRFAKAGMEELAVVDPDNEKRLVGILRRADIINAYNKEVLLSQAS